MFISLSTLLRVLAASAYISFVAAQNQTEITTDQLYAKISSTAPPPGFNAEGGSVFTNFVNAFNNKQYFFLATARLVGERPKSEPVQLSFLDWCSDLTFSDFSNSTLMGYAGHCVEMFLAEYADMQAKGAQLAYSKGGFTHTWGISALFVEQLNIFEGQLHPNNDDNDNVARFWDDGRKTMPWIAWEGHDEGDIDSNAATSSWSLFGEITWMSVEEVAQLFNTSIDEFTPETETFKQVYGNAWINEHKKEAAEDNPNAESELEIVEEVKDETDSAGETTSPAAPDNGDGSSVDASTPNEDDSAGNGRKLTSVAARFAYLQVYVSLVFKERISVCALRMIEAIQPRRTEL